MMKKDNQFRKIVSIPFDAEIYRKIETISKKECRTIPGFIRFAVVRYLEEMKKEGEK